MPAIPGARVPAAVRPDAAAARQDLLHRVVLALFIGIPLAALAAAVPVAWGWGLSWADAGIASVPGAGQLHCRDVLEVVALP